MTGTTCLAQAAAVWDERPTDRQRQIDLCTELAEWGLLSNRHLERITGLPEAIVASISRKSDHSGGRLNVRTLPLIVAFREDWANDRRNGWLLERIVEQGTSMGMVARICELPFNDVRRSLGQVA